MKIIKKINIITKTENFKLILMQGITLFVGFLTLKINTINFDIEKIGLITFFIAQINFISSLRFSGLDICITKHLRGKKGLIRRNEYFFFLLLSFLLSGTSFIYLLGKTFEIKLMLIVCFFYTIGLTFDRSSSFYLTSKRYLIHRSFFIISSVLILISSLTCYFYKLNEIYFLIFYISSVTIVHYVRIIHTFLVLVKFINSLKKSFFKIYLHNFLNIFKNSVLGFSFLGKLQGVSTNIDKIIIGYYSKELLGFYTVSILIPNLMKYIVEPIYIKAIYEMHKFNLKKTILLKLSLYALCIFIFILFGGKFLPLLFDERFSYGLIFSVGSTFYIILLIMDTILMGQLSLENNLRVNIMNIVFALFVQISLMLLFFELQFVNSYEVIPFILALAHLIRIIYARKLLKSNNYLVSSRNKFKSL